MGGHGLTMAMHLLHQLKSARRFTELLTTKYDLLIKEIQCLQPINLQLKVVMREMMENLVMACLSSHV